MKRLCNLAIVLILVFVPCMAKKAIVPPNDPLENRLPLKVTIDEFNRYTKQIGYSGKIEEYCAASFYDAGDILSCQYIKEDLTKNFFDCDQTPIGTIDVRCEFVIQSGRNFEIVFDVLDRNNHLIKTYSYQIPAYSKKLSGTKELMSAFRADYIRDFNQIHAALLSPAQTEMATLVICTPSYMNRYGSNIVDASKIRYFIELDGKYISYTPLKNYKIIEIPTGRHKLLTISNVYFVHGFLNFSMTAYYADNIVQAKQKRANPGAYELPWNGYNSILNIHKGVNYVEITGVGLSEERYQDLLSMGELEETNSNANPITQIATIQRNTNPSSPQSQSLPNIRKSDVDENISVSASKSTNTYVLIIANEQYDLLDNVSYAANDGKIFKEYCEKTLGVPTRQIFYYENASYGRIVDGVEKLKYCLDNFEGSKGIVYYCGHGIPEEKSKQAYIIPVDGKGTNMATCYSLNKLYKTLAGTKAQSVTYFLDACFTGANKEGGMLVAARGVAVKPAGEPLSGKTIVFSASSEDETAMTLTEQGHGLFTYYLLKKLQETKGNVTYGELADYIKANVKKDAFLINEKPQTPVVATSPAVVNTWKSMKLK